MHSLTQKNDKTYIEKNSCEYLCPPYKLPYEADINTQNSVFAIIVYELVFVFGLTNLISLKLQIKYM